MRRQLFSLIFFFKFTRLLSMKNKYVHISEKKNQLFFKFLEAKNSQKSLKFDKFAKKRRVLQFFAIFFSNLPDCLALKMNIFIWRKKYISYYLIF